MQQLVDIDDAVSGAPRAPRPRQRTDEVGLAGARHAVPEQEPPALGRLTARHQTVENRTTEEE
ncbi:MAG: hypothetical protein WKF96_19200 [Solirubrobacteraceae bacterium]